MKTNLKYSLVFLVAFFFCGNVVAQITVPECGVTPFPSNFKELVPDSEGEYYINYDDEPCWTEECSTGNCQPYKENEGLPLGSGAFIFVIFVLGYGGVLYYRRKSARA